VAIELVRAAETGDSAAAATTAVAETGAEVLSNWLVDVAPVVDELRVVGVLWRRDHCSRPSTSGVSVSVPPVGSVDGPPGTPENALLTTLEAAGVEVVGAGTMLLVVPVAAPGLGVMACKVNGAATGLVIGMLALLNDADPLADPRAVDCACTGVGTAAGLTRVVLRVTRKFLCGAELLTCCVVPGDVAATDAGVVPIEVCVAFGSGDVVELVDLEARGSARFVGYNRCCGALLPLVDE
jgi:hypothetical protein